MKFILSLAFYVVSLVAQANQLSLPKDMKLYMIEETLFDEAKEYLMDAFVERGIVLSYTSHVSDMLERTQKDLGIEGTSPYAKAEIYGFCKADLSNYLLRENPFFINYCPYAIHLFSLKNQQDSYISYRKLPQAPEASKEAEYLLAIQNLLEEIIEETGASPLQD